MLVIGLISGAVLAALYFGAQRGDNDSQLGSGLKTLFEKRERPTESPTTRSPAAGVQNTAPTAKFDFYTVLPGMERIILDDTDDTSPEQFRKPASYMLQAASFGNYEDADRLKAQLALSGFEAKIQKVAIAGKGVYYRVRLGPYTNKRHMKNDKQRLQKLGINGLPLRLTEN